MLAEFTLLPIKLIIVSIACYFNACCILLVINFVIDGDLS